MWKSIIISLSFASMGIVLYLATTNLRDGLRSHDHIRKLFFAFAIARAGFAGMVGLITEAVFHAATIPFSWRVALYALFAVMVSLGYLGIALESRWVMPSMKEKK